MHRPTIVKSLRVNEKAVSTTCNRSLSVCFPTLIFAGEFLWFMPDCNFTNTPGCSTFIVLRLPRCRSNRSPSHSCQVSLSVLLLPGHMHERQLFRDLNPYYPLPGAIYSTYSSLSCTTLLSQTELFCIPPSNEACLSSIFSTPYNPSYDICVYTVMVPIDQTQTKQREEQD